MTNKTSTALFVLTLSGYTMSFAGSMGPVKTTPQIIPFAGLEASYTWHQYDGIGISGSSSSQTSDPWGGRFYAGFLYSLNESIYLSSEFGGGYYGSESVTNSSKGISARYTADGYDLLVGAGYRFNAFEIFGKVGAMMENWRLKSSKNLALVSPGGLLNGQYDYRGITAETLPEIKVGGIYNWNDRLGVSLAYMHVFGAKMQASMNISSSTTPPSINFSGENNMQNPTLDSVMLGLRYNFLN